MPSIFRMFAPSPIRPLQKHMGKAHQCAHTLVGFFAAVFDQDWQKAEQVDEEIVLLEHKADAIKADIRSHLPKNLFLPIPREDVLQILILQDKIPNKVKDIAGLVLGRRMHIPPTIAPLYLDLLTRSVDATEHAHRAIDELDQLLETGFRRDEVTLVESIIDKLCATEHETDELQIKVRRELFKLEKELSPVDVIFLYQVFDWTGDIADRAEKVGQYLQLILAR